MLFPALALFEFLLMPPTVVVVIDIHLPFLRPHPRHVDTVGQYAVD
jgi:hypothetical protein